MSEFCGVFQIQEFLAFVKTIYQKLPSHLAKIFEPRTQRKVKDMSEINVEAWLQDIYTLTPVVTDKKNSDNQNVTVSLFSFFFSPAHCKMDLCYARIYVMFDLCYAKMYA